MDALAVEAMEVFVVFTKNPDGKNGTRVWEMENKGDGLEARHADILPFSPLAHLALSLPLTRKGRVDSRGGTQRLP
jgi:hypothetical protein